MTDDKKQEQTKANQCTNSHMWAEKYRPRCLADCVLDHLDPKIVENLYRWEENGNFPNLLLVGEPGTGKSTIASILGKKHQFALQHRNGAFLTKSELSTYDQNTGTPLGAHKHVIQIDEVDAVGKGGLTLLRAAIDRCAETAKWIFTSNDRVIYPEGLISRLVRVDFSWPELDARKKFIEGMTDRGEKILELEGIENVPRGEIKKLAEEALPDIRKFIEQLQLNFEYENAA